MIRHQYRVLIVTAFACVTAWAAQPTAFAQVTPAGAPASGAAQRVYSPAELEELVGPIALYPDDLVAIILPASTYPLQVVQADRFLDKRKGNPQLQIDPAWQDSVKSLVNYPEVVKKMSGDLEWTEELGESVVTDNAAVLEAVQVFRRRAQSAGNLKSDSRQKIVVEQQIIQIEPADPQVIYVPQYQPSVVVVAGAPAYVYSAPYPVYHYPYPPGSALAAGIIWGAALGAVWNGGRYATHYGGGSVNNSITINRGGNTINTGGNVNRGGRPSTLPANAWKPTKQPGQVGGAGNRPATPRVGDPRPATGGGSMGGSGFSSRPSQGDVGRGGAQSPSTRPASGTAGRAQGGAFGGMDSGAAAHRASARGNESRGSFGGSQGMGGGGMQAARGGGGGGGARASAGGGGARGGGGGGGGGGGRGGGGGGGRR